MYIIIYHFFRKSIQKISSPHQTVFDEIHIHVLPDVVSLHSVITLVHPLHPTDEITECNQLQVEHSISKSLSETECSESITTYTIECHSIQDNGLSTASSGNTDGALMDVPMTTETKHISTNIKSAIDSVDDYIQSESLMAYRT